MPYFDVIINTQDILMVTIRSQELGDRKFSLETFELFVRNLPVDPSEGYELEINEFSLKLLPKQYEGFYQNCRNLLEVVRKAYNIKLSLKHNSR